MNRCRATQQVRLGRSRLLAQPRIIFVQIEYAARHHSYRDTNALREWSDPRRGERRRDKNAPARECGRHTLESGLIVNETLLD